MVQVWREQGEPRFPELDEGGVRVPIRLDALVLVERPSSHYNSKGELNKEGRSHPLPENRKPDVDNLLKLLMDAMNKRAYKDDVKVTTSTQKRRWSNVSGTEVTISIDHDEWDYRR